MTDASETLVGPQRNSLFAIIEPTKAEGALADLADRGFEARLLQPEDAESWRAGLQGGNVFKKLNRLLAQEAIDMGLRYSEQRPGEAVIRVDIPSAAAAEPAREILRGHGGYYINYFGQWTHDA